MKTPTLPTVKKRFTKAKEIRCLSLNAIINVATVKDFTFNEAENAWKSGPLTFWKDGKYAEITKKKCNPADCKKCKECAEKRKNRNN